LIEWLFWLAERWRAHDKTVRPHFSLGYQPPRKPGSLNSNQDEEKWKAEYASHFLTPATAARYL